MPRDNDLQASVHAPHRDIRERLISALVSTGATLDARRACRLADCCRGSALTVDYSLGKALPWLSRCGSRLCSFCGRSRTAQLTIKLSTMLMRFKQPKHLVLTYPSYAAPLGEQLKRLKKAFCYMRELPEWKKRVAGGVYCLEVTFNTATGMWHPHLHVLIDSEYFPQQTLVALWKHWFPGAVCQWISAVDNIPGVCHEAAKYVSKPPNLAPWPDHAVLEYVTNIYRHRLVQPFGSVLADGLETQEEKQTPQRPTRQVGLYGLTADAAAGGVLATDICAAAYQRWPMFRRFIKARVPEAPLLTECRYLPGYPIPQAKFVEGGRLGQVEPGTSLQSLEDLLFHLVDQACTDREQKRPSGEGRYEDTS